MVVVVGVGVVVVVVAVVAVAVAVALIVGLVVVNPPGARVAAVTGARTSTRSNFSKSNRANPSSSSSKSNSSSNSSLGLTRVVVNPPGARVAAVAGKAFCDSTKKTQVYSVGPARLRGS